MSGLFEDLRFTARSLGKRPGYAVVVILTLALGIGSNTAIFSIVNGVLLRPLPYKDPDRLVLLSETRKGEEVSVSYPNFEDWRSRNRVFSQLASFQASNLNLQLGDEPERVRAYRVSSGFFETMGVKPVVGRTLSDMDQVPGAPPAAVLTYELWQRRWQGSRDAVGKVINLSDRLYTVVGVMPPKFTFYDNADLWVPVSQFASDKDMTRRDAHPSMFVVARLKPEVDLGSAQAGMAAIAAQLESEYPDSNAQHGVSIKTVEEDLVGGVRRSLLILLGAVGFVFLIACLNVASLFAVRSSTRLREIAIRVALGAHRPRLVQQFLTEGVLLGICGGAAGLLLSELFIRLLVHYDPGNIPRLSEANIDGRVVAFASGIALLSGLLFGLVPIAHSWSIELQDTLKASSGSGTGNVRWHQIRQLLVTAEVALSVVLLIGAGLMILSFYKLASTNPGFDTRKALVMNMALPEAKYPEKAQIRAFYRELLRQLQAMPGVRAAGIANPTPLSGSTRSDTIEIEGRVPVSREDTIHVDWSPVSPDYFKAIGIPLLQGRTFLEREGEEPATAAVVVDSAAAARFWPQGTALGKRLRRSDTGNEEPWCTVVGIVGPVKQEGPGSESRLQVYFPFWQIPLRSSTLVVRTESDPRALAADVRKQVNRLNPTLPVYNVNTLEEIFSKSVAQPRFSTLLLGIFAILALVLSTVGVYSVVAYSVSQRTREIGVRMALGAGTGAIWRYVVGRAIVPVLIGVGIGLSVAFMVTRVLSSLLFGVEARDLGTFLAVSVLILLAGVAGSLVPARRAARVSPVSALKYE